MTVTIAEILNCDIMWVELSKRSWLAWAKWGRLSIPRAKARASAVSWAWLLTMRRAASMPRAMGEVFVVVSSFVADRLRSISARAIACISAFVHHMAARSEASISHCPGITRNDVTQFHLSSLGLRNSLDIIVAVASVIFGSLDLATKLKSRCFNSKATCSDRNHY